MISSKNISELLAKTSSELLKCHDDRNWSELEDTAIKHFQLMGIDNNKAQTAAKYVMNAYREHAIIDDALDRKEIKLKELGTNYMIVNKKRLPKIALGMYTAHYKVLVSLGEKSGTEYHHTMWWLQYLIKHRTKDLMPKLSILYHLFEQQRKKYGMEVAIKTMPHLKKIMEAQDSKDEKKEREEFIKYWDKVLSSGSKAVMY